MNITKKIYFLSASLIVFMNLMTLKANANAGETDVTSEAGNFNQNRNPSSMKKVVRISRTSTTSHFVEVDLDFPEDRFDQLQIENFDSQG